MAYKIEKNIPIPAIGRSRNDGASATVQAMQIGDSVLIDKKRAAFFYTLGRRYNKKLTGRTVEPKKIRIWCIAQS